MKSPSILEKFNVKLRKNAKSQSYCVFNERETSFLTGIWITSSSIFSRGVSLKASISIRSSYLYSNYYHAKTLFGNLIFAIIARILCRNDLNTLHCLISMKQSSNDRNNY